jgi:catechol 2,3-dioxygenase-like lactoylglutathione lyase family enzyme
LTDPLGTLDHVGYLVADLDAAVAEFQERFALQVVRPVILPQFSILGHYLGSGTGNIELFTITDAEMLADRLGGERILLDHVGFEVKDIVANAAELSTTGVRFSGPDRRQEVTQPIELGGILHLWTVPQTSCGQSLQLLQR